MWLSSAGTPLGADVNASEKDLRAICTWPQLWGRMEGEIASPARVAGPGTHPTSSTRFYARWEEAGERVPFPGDCWVVIHQLPRRCYGPSPSLPSVMPGAVTSRYACGAATCRVWVVPRRIASVLTSHVPTPPKGRQSLHCPPNFSQGRVRASSPQGVPRNTDS